MEKSVNSENAATPPARTSATPQQTMHECMHEDAGYIAGLLFKVFSNLANYNHGVASARHPDDSSECNLPTFETIILAGLIAKYADTLRQTQQASLDECVDLIDSVANQAKTRLAAK